MTEYAQTPVPIRPAVMNFAMMMEWKLRQNDYKGGWKDLGVYHIIHRIKQELKDKGLSEEQIDSEYQTRSKNLYKETK